MLYTLYIIHINYLHLFSYDKIFGYSTTHTSDAVFILGGGEREQDYNIVYRFKNDQWTKMSDLQQGRINHASILIGTETVVIGGWIAFENSFGETTVSKLVEAKSSLSILIEYLVRTQRSGTLKLATREQ